MPYELRGNSVVKSNSGEVVKAHPTRAKALAHLRALKANVEEGAPAALGALLEGFNASERRGFHGRWVGTHAGKVLRVFHGDTSLGDVKPGESRTHTMIGVGRVVGEAGRTISTGDIAKVVDRAAGSPEPSPRVIPKGGSANELRGGIPFVHGVGPEGQRARDRSASSLTTEHADTRDKLTNLPQGQSYGLHGPRGQVGRVDRTKRGWEVHRGADAPKVHRTPSSAAGEAMRIQRTAASSQQQADVMMRNYRHAQEVAGMNARQDRRAAEEQVRAAARNNQRIAGGGAIAAAAAHAQRERADILAKSSNLPEPPASRHGGFVVGDHVGYRTPSVVNGAVEGYGAPQVGTVSGLQRNGYLRVREPVHGTTVDVHHSHATPIPSSHFQKLTGSSSRERGVAQLQLEKLIKVPRPRIREAEACPDVLGSLLG